VIGGAESALTIRSLNKNQEITMRKIALAMLVLVFASGATLTPAVAQNMSCASKAMDKNGKPLAGAAKASFMKKCLRQSCAEKAVSKDGKPLAGAAKSSFMKKCESAG
jgi:hypothetical protein